MSRVAAHDTRPAIPRTIRALAVPIILAWVAITAALNLLIPQVEKVGMANAVSMSPQDAPAVIAAKRMGAKFQESTSDSIAMVVLIGDEPLGDDARRYYDTLVAEFESDARHVEHVANFWGDMITAAGVQSSDGKAAYVQLNLVGDQGSTQGNESVEAVREIIHDNPPPVGLNAYVTGPAPLTTDSLEASDSGMIKMTVVTMIVITIMLALVYRSVSTVLLILAIVGIEMGSARGAVALIGHLNLIDFSTFSVPLLTALAIAAGTDYAIFLIGRYHEARQNGEEPEQAYYTAFHGVGHVILGSGLTVAGAMLTLRLTRLAYFNSLAYPSAIALIIVLAAALTAAPAVLVVGSRFGLLEPKRMLKTRGWRKVGTATVRWPKPILAASTAVVLLGILVARDVLLLLLFSLAGRLAGGLAAGLDVLTSPQVIELVVLVRLVRVAVALVGHELEPRPPRQHAELALRRVHVVVVHCGARRRVGAGRRASVRGRGAAGAGEEGGRWSGGPRRARGSEGAGGGCAALRGRGARPHSAARSRRTSAAARGRRRPPHLAGGCR